MSLQLLEHPTVSLIQGHGLDLPTQAARARASWMSGRQGRSPVLLVALLWARHCTDAVRVLDSHLDALFADYRCTPQSWSEAQAARQVLAALNLHLHRRSRDGEAIPELSAGLLLIQGGEAQFLQSGAIGLLRCRGGTLQSLLGRESPALGSQAELALIQHSLPLSQGEALLLAPQPLIEIADLQSFRRACEGVQIDQLGGLLEPLLKAPGAAALLLPGDMASPPPLTVVEQWPVPAQAQTGQTLDGWRLLENCSYGPPGRLFRARDRAGREALLWLAEHAADEAFWQREWVLRRCPPTGLPQVLSSREPRRHAFLLVELPPAGMRSLDERMESEGPMDFGRVLRLLDQLVVAVRALQRRGMQGLWLDPRLILLGDDGRLLLLPEHAAVLPGARRQALPPEAAPLAPELREDRPVDGRADQFGLAALTYWLLCGQWPAIARADADPQSIYRPLAPLLGGLPGDWDRVLETALAAEPQRRFSALSELQRALQRPAPVGKSRPPVRRLASRWRLMLAVLLGLQLLLGLWISL